MSTKLDRAYDRALAAARRPSKHTKKIPRTLTIDLGRPPYVTFERGSRLDSGKIKNALTLLHWYERNESTENAFKRAVRNVGLTRKEAETLASVIHMEMIE